MGFYLEFLDLDMIGTFKFTSVSGCSGLGDLLKQDQFLLYDLDPNINISRVSFAITKDGKPINLLTRNSVSRDTFGGSWEIAFEFWRSVSQIFDIAFYRYRPHRRILAIFSACRMLFEECINN
jgi:hypothetical protein